MASTLRLLRTEWVKLCRHRLTWVLLLALVAVFALQIRGAYLQVREEPDIPTKVDEYLEAHVEAWPRWDIGMAVLIARDGQVLVSKGYGLANRVRGMPIGADTIFPIASITEQFTALAIVQLVEGGLLAYDDPLSDFFPAYPQGDEITIHHLLTHSSGLPGGSSLFIPETLEFEPGAKASYSNLNYLLLGRIVEQVSGQSYADYVREHILIPAGMQRSGYDIATASDDPDTATGYVRRRDGPQHAPYGSLDVAGGAGALYSTASDLLRWDRALREGTLVGAEALERIFTPHYPFGEHSMGYGWVVGELVGREMAMHGGSYDGATGIILRFLDKDAAIVVLSNTDWAPVERIAQDLAAILFGEHYEVPLRHTEDLVEIDPALYDAYAGEYVIAETGMVLVPRREGTCFLLDLRLPSDETTIELYPVSETRFIASMGDTALAFVVDESGAVSQIQVTSSGQPLPPALRRGVSEPVWQETEDLNQLLGGIETQPSYNDFLQAVTLPGILRRVPLMHDWMTVAFVLLGVVSVAQEFPWGTMRAALARGVPRASVVVTKFLALAGLAVCFSLALWLACGVLGAWTTRALVGSVDWGFLDGAFLLEQASIVARTWWIALSSVAVTAGVYVWVGRPGPGVVLRFLGYFFSLLAYVFLMMLPLYVLIVADVEPSAFGDSLWARLVELLPHYNARIVAHWGEPGNVFEMDYGTWTMARIFGLNYDPWYAVTLLALYGLATLVPAAIAFGRRDMRP